MVSGIIRGRRKTRRHPPVVSGVPGLRFHPLSFLRLCRCTSTFFEPWVRMTTASFTVSTPVTAYKLAAPTRASTLSFAFCDLTPFRSFACLMFCVLRPTRHYPPSFLILHDSATGENARARNFMKPSVVFRYLTSGVDQPYFNNFFPWSVPIGMM